jgi:hypothetical protein
MMMIGMRKNEKIKMNYNLFFNNNKNMGITASQVKELREITGI